MALSLILEVPGPQGLSLGEARRKVFGHGGGRIGRASDCDWVLSSGYVSRHHATVSYADGAFHITSVSENGLAVNDVACQLPRFESRALASGDRLFIDEYEITVLIGEGQDASEPGVDGGGQSGAAVRYSEAETARVQALPLLRSVEPPVSGSPGSVVFDVPAFLRGAGLDPQGIPPEMAPVLGQIVRCVAQGMIDVLGARAEFRSQFRLPVTRIQISQNNPLKFAPTGEDALAAMLRTRGRGYMGPLEAFEDAFDDVRFHLLATLAGMRAGFESLLKQLDPKRIEQLSKRGEWGFFQRFRAKQRCWDLYGDVFEDMASNADAVFQRMYGEEFSVAYERQLDELKRKRAKPTS